MSQRPSACVPPPSDYAQKPRNQNTPNRHRDKRGRGNHRDYGRQSYSVSFHSDKHGSDCSESTRSDQLRDRFHQTDDDDYFSRIPDNSENDGHDDPVKIPASNSTNATTATAPTNTQVETEGDDEEDDPLDAYMKSLEGGGSSASVDQDSASKVSNNKERDLRSRTNAISVESEKARAIRLDIDDADDVEESYYKYVEEKKNQVENTEEEDMNDQVEYDDDGNIIGVRKVKKEVEPLPPVDHSTICYKKFDKKFYCEHEEISKLSDELANDLRAKLEIKVSGNRAPRPVCSFAHFKFDEKLMKVIRRSDYYQPTPIQAQAIPTALMGRNIIGIAMTGSGKTAAYLWPMIIHIMNQPDLERGDGPIGLILVPTRELALQVYGEARKFSSSYKLSVVCAYGGGSRYEQARDLESGSEIVVATPGRIIDLVKSGATNLRRVTYLVLDEADRFFEMGFEIQVRSICDHIRPDRQTLLFSATFKHRVEQLARSIVDDPIKIIQKNIGEANEDVTQHVVVFQDPNQKWSWLTNKLVEFTSAGSVLIFVTRILNSEELHKKLADHGKEALLLHGDMEQSERNRVITAFKRKDCDVMIATDVAARGLDISHIRTVINYDVARDIDTHTHRIGRTGRAGSKGDAFTLLDIDKDKEFAGHLVKNLESSNQRVDDDLLRLAMRSQTFRRSRERNNQKNSRRRQEHQHDRVNQSGHAQSHGRDQHFDHASSHRANSNRDRYGRHGSRSDHRHDHSGRLRYSIEKRHDENPSRTMEDNKRTKWRH